MNAYLKSTLASLAAVAIFAACYSSHDYTPTDTTMAEQQTALQPNLASMPALPPEAQRAIDQSAATGKVLCNAAVAKIPGQYTILSSIGNVHGSTFTGSTSLSFWNVVNLQKSTSPPPSPIPSISPTPGANPEYVYYGTFTLKNGKGGCAYLIATQNGKPITKQLPGNAIAAGVPRLKILRYKVVPTKLFGKLKITITGLSASGGKGSLTLQTLTTMKTYTTGTMQLVGRIAIK